MCVMSASQRKTSPLPSLNMVSENLIAVSAALPDIVQIRLSEVLM